MTRLILLFLLASSTVAAQEFTSLAGGPQRLIILADMGNEPDEEQQMMHMLMCSNEFDLEGLIAVTGKYLRPEAADPYKQHLHPELFENLIGGYAAVYENLRLHSDTYPAPEYLETLVVSGQSGYGMESTGPGRSSEGSRLIIRAVLRDDPRPVYIVVNAGSNTLAQALIDYAAGHTESEVDEFVQKLIIFENGAQDNAGAWICNRYPSIKWYRSNYQTYCYGGPSIDGQADNSGNVSALGPCTWEPYAYSGLGQHQWALEHIIGNHGPFGNYYPIRQFKGGGISFLEGGGTIPWLGLCSPGLSDIRHMEWGGWSGRFSREKVENYWSKHTSVNTDEKKTAPFFVFPEEPDSWTDPETGMDYEGIFVPVWRWRRAFFNDFTCRMDWCKQPYEKANHHPLAAVNGNRENSILFMKGEPGQTITLDASRSTDPDGDSLSCRWFFYPEAGTYTGSPVLSGEREPWMSFRIPEDAAGTELHIILEVKDNNPIASLYDYRRVVIVL